METNNDVQEIDIGPCYCCKKKFREEHCSVFKWEIGVKTMEIHAQQYKIP